MKSSLYWKHIIIFASEAGGIFVLFITKSPVVYSIWVFNSCNSSTLVTNTGLDDKFVTVTSKYTLDQIVVNLQSMVNVWLESSDRYLRVTSSLAWTLWMFVIRTSALDLTRALPFIASVEDAAEKPIVRVRTKTVKIEKRKNIKLFFLFFCNFFFIFISPFFSFLAF